MIRHAFRLWAIVTIALAARAAGAAPLTVVKSTTVVSDQINALNPRILPGSNLDYTLLITNPVANLFLPVRQVAIVDPIPEAMKLRVLDLGAAQGGPVEFVDGNLLNLGLLGSGLAYTFVALGDADDSLDFFDGTNWGYVPRADAGGYDTKVRAIRLTLSGTQATNTSFRLRYRAAVR